MTKFVTGSEVFIYDTEGFQEHTKKAVAGVLYRITKQDGRKANIEPANRKSSAPPLCVMLYRLKAAGGTTTPKAAPYVTLETPVEGRTSFPFRKGDEVRIPEVHLMDVAPKFYVPLSGTKLTVVGATSKGTLQVQSEGTSGGINGSGLYHIHPSRLNWASSSQPSKTSELTSWGGVHLGDLLTISDRAFLRSDIEAAFPEGLGFTLVEIKNMVIQGGRPPVTFFRFAHCDKLVRADRFNHAPVRNPKAPEFGPVPLDGTEYDVLPTAFSGAIGEVLEHKPSSVMEVGMVRYLIRTKGGMLVHVKSDDDFEYLSEKYASSTFSNNWMYVRDHREDFYSLEWLHGKYGSFVTALTYPSLPPVVERLRNIGEL